VGKSRYEYRTYEYTIEDIHIFEIEEDAGWILISAQLDLANDGWWVFLAKRKL
jgi:hypothetical protein